METRIAENIRAYRKQRGLTQEQLAEVLGVSVGAVYKWESRSSLPELRLIMEMADFFDVSVDALLGYQIKDNRLSATVEQLWKAGSSRDYNALSEAEKAIRKYPHSFDVVYAAAFLYYTFGAGTKKEPWLRRAIELLDSARLLVAQCTDPRVNESYLGGMMAEMHEMLGETDKALELLKANNAGAIFDDMIGISLLSHGGDPEEANDFLEDGLLRTVSRLIQTVIGYAMLFKAKNDNASGMEMMRWFIPILEGLKKTEEPDFLDKMIVVFLIFLAIFQHKSGSRKAAKDTLRKAKPLARAFDAAPNYAANRVKYVRESEMTNAHDLLGETAMDAADKILQDADPELRSFWVKICSYEDDEEGALKMEVCFGEPADIDSWMALVRKVRENFPGLETEESLNEHRQTVLRFMEKRQALCVKSKDRMQGVLLFSRNRNMICCLAVDPEHRRCGVASALLKTALKELDRSRDITVSTFREEDEKGLAPRALYRKFGFTEDELTEEFGYPNQVFVLPRENPEGRSAR